MVHAKLKVRLAVSGRISFSLLLSVCCRRCEDDITLGLVALWWSAGWIAQSPILWIWLKSPYLDPKESQFSALTARRSGVPFIKMPGVMARDKYRNWDCGESMWTWAASAELVVKAKGAWVRREGTMELRPTSCWASRMGLPRRVREGLEEVDGHHLWAVALETVDILFCKQCSFWLDRK